MIWQKKIQTVLDRFYYARQYAMELLTYLSMRVCGFEPTLEVVRKQSGTAQDYIAKNLDQADDIDGLLALAKECWKSAVDRKAIVIDKCKTLITLSSFLLGFVGIALPKQLDFDFLLMKMLVFLAMLSLLNAVILLVVVFGIGSEAVVSLEQGDVGLSKDNLKKSLINSYGRCQVDIDARTNYLVDLLRTSRFFFLSAFLILVILFSTNFFKAKESDQIEKTITELRGHPELIELLRGPKGIKGDVGPTGSQGKTGLVDYKEIAKYLLDDPRFVRIFRQLLEEVSNREEQNNKSVK